MTKFKIDDTVRYDSSVGSYGIITGIHENFSANDYDQRYIVKWYYGKDVKGEYMTSVSRYVTEGSINAVSADEFWMNANRQGWSGPLGEPVPAPIFTRNEILSWFKGVPVTTGTYLVQHESHVYPFVGYWSAISKEFTDSHGELIPDLQEGTIYHAAWPRGFKE
jgi:hypothetical protein